MVSLGSVPSFNRTKKHSYAMFRNMMTSLIMHEKINTTLGKAKVLMPMLNSLFFHAKKNTYDSRRKVISTIRTPVAREKLMTTLQKQYKYGLN
jgi:large subunit ribosomal protein L17